MQAAFSDADLRWAAVVARDARADEAFVYAVRTTGVYCRPSCGSRRPRREHVAFHDTGADAERAGFRPCRRCRPDQPALRVRHAATVAAACRAIDAAPVAPRLAVLARRAGLSPHHFHRLFKRVTGLTPRRYAASVRATRVREALPRSASVTDALHASGFGSAGRFYAEAGRALGMSPSAYRRGGSQADIRYATGDSALGTVLVAESEKGLCAILLGDEVDPLLAALRARFPRATIEPADETFGGRLRAVVSFVESPGIGLDLPLDLRGTLFQQRVWDALRAIPPGRTVTYAELAASIGAPTAVRAVAGACAANMLAVAVPCHRVIRRDGSLSGYRWGVERKAQLLRAEADTPRD